MGSAEMEDQRATPKHYSNATTGGRGARGRRKEEADRLRQASHGRGRAGFKDDRLQFDMKQMRQKHTSPQPTSPLLLQRAAGGLAVTSAHLPR